MKRYIHFTFEGKPLFSFWVDDTSDGGFSLGPRSLEEDIHLTVFPRNGKLYSHVTYRGIGELKDSLVAKVTTNRHLSRNLGRMFKNRLQFYHGNKICYIFTPNRWEIIKTFFPRVDEKGDIVFPVEAFRVVLNMNFTNKRLWKKRRISSLFGQEPNFGYIKTRSGLRWITPISKNAMLSYPLLKVDEIGNYFLEVMCCNEFFDYLKIAGVSAKIRAKVREKIKAQARDGNSD